MSSISQDRGSNWKQLKALVEQLDPQELQTLADQRAGRILIITKNYEYRRPGAGTIECWYPLELTGPEGKAKLLRPRAEGYCFYALQQASGSAKKGGSTQKMKGAFAHHFLWFSAKGFDVNLLEPIPNPFGGTYSVHISHLCHDPRCCNPGHVVREPAWLNILRKDCNGFDCHCADTITKLGLVDVEPRKCMGRMDSVLREKIVRQLTSYEKPKKEKGKGKMKLDIKGSDEDAGSSSDQGSSPHVKKLTKKPKTTS